MRSFRLLTCVVLFLAVGLLAGPAAWADEAPTSVAGVVRDASGGVLPGASVSLVTGVHTTARTIVTNERGEFRFDNIAAGRYVLAVSFPGFAERRVAVTVAATTKPVEIRLEPTPVEAEVTVTATAGTAQERNTVPQQINIIESSEIFERAKAVVAQAVLEEPGVNIVRTSPTMAGIYVRGLTGNKVNVFVDGVRYSTSSARGGVNTFLDLVEPTNLAAVEVLRGPNSAQYGSDAIGGSVQFLAPVPALAGNRPMWSGSAALRAGTADKSAGFNASLGYGARKFGFFASIAGRRSGTVRPGEGIDSHSAITRFLGLPSDKLMGSRLPDTGFDQYGGNVKINWTPSNKDQLLVNYTRGQQDRGKRYDQLLGGDGNLVADLRNLMLDFFYIKYNRADVGPFDQVTATYSYNTQREERVNQGGNGNPRNTITHEYERTTAQGFQVRATTRTGSRGDLLVGAELYPERITAPSFGVNPVTNVSTVRRGRVPDGATYLSAGIYAQQSYELVPGRLHVQGGGRWSHARYRAYAADSPLVNGKPLWPDDSLDTSTITFRGGVVATPWEGWTVRASASRGFRAPHITDLGTLGLTGSGFTVSAAEVAGRGTVGTTAGSTAVSTGKAVEPAGPETSYQYEAALAYRKGRISTEASFFINTVYDNIVYQSLIMPGGAVGQMLGDQAITSQGATGVVYVPASTNPVLVRTNLGDARITGLEHTLDIRLWPRFTIGTVLTWLHAKDLDTGLAPNIEGGTPGRDFYLKLRYSHPGGRYWLEPIVHAVARQDRLSTLDLEDRRTGGMRTRSSIKNFFYNGATARGWVTPGPDGKPGNADDILTVTGETLAQVQARVLGTADSSPLFTAVPGYVTVAVRGGFRVGSRHEVIIEGENLTDKNYRGVAWGMDAPGRGLSVAWVSKF